MANEPPRKQLLWIVIWAVATHAPTIAGSTFRETNIVLGKVPRAAMLNRAAPSADAQHFAFPVLRGGHYTVWHNGTEGARYDRLGDLKFSCTGLLGYTANKDGKWRIIVGTNESATFEDVVSGYPVFSCDGSRYAYIAVRGGKPRMVIDEKEGQSFDLFVAGTCIFSPDGSRVAYAATRGRKGHVVIDGKESRPFDEIMVSSLAFSSDGKRFVYAARSGKEWLLVDGDKECALRGRTACVSLSPDGRRMGYFMEVSNTWRAVIDGELYQGQEASYGSVVFSPDSRRWAYPIRDGDMEKVFLDGVESTAFDYVKGRSFVFSPDSKKFAYSAGRGREFVVVNGIEGQAFNAVSPPMFSPDSRHMAYVASTREGHCFVINEKQSRMYDEIIRPAIDVWGTLNILAIDRNDNFEKIVLRVRVDFQ